MFRSAVATILLICVTLLFPRTSEAQVTESDSLALVAIYNAMGGAGWNFPQNANPWLQGWVQTWYGVSVTNKRVTWLVLNSLGLSGSLPDDLADLDQLGGLIFQNNQISGSLTGSPVLELSNLRALDLSQNLFSGEIPSEIGNLTQLGSLSLGVNSFTGEIPLSIGNLTSLTWLQLIQNQLSGEIPTGLGNLNSLNTLGLQDNNLEGNVPADFAGLTSIISINLENNQLTGFPALPPFPSLSTLYLTNNRFTFEDFEHSFDMFAASGVSVLTPQADVEAVVDGAGTVSVSVGGANNVYQWYADNEATPERDGFWIQGANNDSYTPTHSGDYYVRITNSYLDTLPGQFSNIELFSEIVTVTVVPNTWEVNTTADDPDGDTSDGVCDTGSASAGLTGMCTLRAAIETVNAGVGGEITFNIPGGGIPSIQPTYALPWIVVPVELNGESQPGGRVELSGNQAGPNVHGLVLAGGNSLVKGLTINRFTGSGIVLTGNDNSFVENTFIGSESDGYGKAGNGGNGIWIDDTSLNRIGDVGDTNGNSIVANKGNGILITGENAIGNVVQNNTIGTFMSSDAGNELSGIYIEDGSITTIGGREDGLKNRILYNGGDGISITGTGDSNSVYRNEFGGNDGLAIDLGNDGPTGNDLGDGRKETVDVDTGPNHLANSPSYVTAAPVPGNQDMLMVTGVVEPSNENPAPYVQLYRSQGAKESGQGIPVEYLKATTANAAGIFQTTISKRDLFGHEVTATATNAAGSTSEFSRVCIDTNRDGKVDSDGDGLCDNWEKNGIDYDGDGDVDLPLQSAPYGTSVTKKDLFVELDYMVGDGTHCKEPKVSDLSEVENAFERMNIALHLFLDEEVPHIDILRFSSPRKPGPQNDFYDLKNGDPFTPCSTEQNGGHFGTLDDRTASNCAAILGAKRLFFRYAIAGHRYELYPDSGGLADPHGDEYIVTVGAWPDDSFKAMGGTQDIELGRSRVFANAFMHELGHTLGLHHGGGDRINCKPNYPSIMSYSLEHRTFIPDRVLDYSRQVMPTLDESNLNEPVGLGGPVNRKVRFRTKKGNFYRTWANRRPINWDEGDKDGDGNSWNDTQVSADINDLDFWGCEGDGSVLKSYDDWAKLELSFLNGTWFGETGKRTTGYQSEAEPTYEMFIQAARSVDYDGDGFSNFEDNCPPYENPDQLDTDGDGVGDMCEQSVSDLIVTMSASAETIAPGLPLSYTMAVYNVGPDTTSVTLVDTLATQMTVTSAVPDRGSCSTNQNVVLCDLGNMFYDDSLGVTLTVQSSTEATIENTVHIWSDYYDPDSTNNSASVTTVVAVSRDDNDEVPEDYALKQNYPNPFNPMTTIEYSVPVAGHVRLTILDLLGREVKTVVDHYQASGNHTAQVDGTDLSSGVYLYRLVAGDYSMTRRMVLLK